jgi:integration host factor subunit beta
MNRTDLIAQFADRKNLSYSDAEKIVLAIIESIVETLVAGNRVEIRGFGSFVTREYDGYEGRNPKNGKVVSVKPKKAPFFKVGKELKERVNCI